MNRVHLLLKSDWSIVLIMTGAVKQIVEEGRILVTVHHIFSTNNGMQNLISALKTSQPNGFTDADGYRNLRVAKNATSLSEINKAASEQVT